SSGPFALMIAHERQEGPVGATDDDFKRKGFKLGGSWKVLPTTTLYAMAERIDIDDNPAGVGFDFGSRDAYYLAAKHSMGNIDLQANFMVARDSDDADDGAKSFALGAIYNFSKRTNIGAYYAHTRNDDD